MSNQDKIISIVGAGLAGSLLANVLAKHGYQVVLYEGRNDMRTTNISAGRSINLALAERGIRALDLIGIMPKLKPYLVPMYGRALHFDSGKEDFQAYSIRKNDAIYSVGRSLLNSLLLTELDNLPNVTVKFNQNCTGVNVEKQTLTFTQTNTNNTIESKFDFCIGADGFNSVIRNSICETCEVNIAPLQHCYKELTLQSNAQQFMLKPDALHIWPRGEFMLIALPNFDKSFTLTLFMPQHGSAAISTLNDEKSIKTFFHKYFPDIINLIPDLVTQFSNNPIGKLATVRCDTWHKDNCLIIGDAAHAIVPFHGQGMNCSFEDVYCINELLPKFTALASLAKELQRLRKINTDTIADLAIENYLEMRANVRNSNYQLKRRVAQFLQQKFPKHFIPRYSLVMFHTIPYSQAEAIGRLQENILNKLTATATTLQEVDFDLAYDLVEEAFK